MSDKIKICITKSTVLLEKINENQLTNIFFTVGLIDWENDDIFLSLPSH